MQAGEYLLDNYIFIHLSNPADKLAALTVMLTKLWAFVGGQCGEDSADALTHHEILLPGQVMMKATTERLNVWLSNFRDQVGLGSCRIEIPIFLEVWQIGQLKRSSELLNICKEPRTAHYGVFEKRGGMAGLCIQICLLQTGPSSQPSMSCFRSSCVLATALAGASTVMGLQVQRDMQRAPNSVLLDEEKYIKSVADKVQGLADIGQKLEYLLSTGNLQSRGGLDLSQSSGFTIVAERLNFFRWGRLCLLHSSLHKCTFLYTCTVCACCRNAAGHFPAFPLCLFASATAPTL